MALLLLTAPVTAKKRHHSKMKNHPITMIDQDTAGVVAYSDTTSLATDSLAFDSLANGNTYSRTVHFTLDDQDISRLMGPLKDLNWHWRARSVYCYHCNSCHNFPSIMPFVIFGLLIFLIVKHHNDKQRLARAALMSGQPIPQNIVKEPVETDDEMWRRGIKNVFLGLGVAVLCYCLGANSLAGIGWLILICGAGQAVIAKTTKKKSNNIEPPTSNPGAPSSSDNSTPPPPPVEG